MGDLSSPLQDSWETNWGQLPPPRGVESPAVEEWSRTPTAVLDWAAIFVTPVNPPTTTRINLVSQHLVASCLDQTLTMLYVGKETFTTGRVVANMPLLHSCLFGLLLPWQHAGQVLPLVKLAAVLAGAESKMVLEPFYLELTLFLGRWTGSIQRTPSSAGCPLWKP